MQTDDSVDAPADSIKWAKGIFLTRSVEERPSLLQRIVAILQSEIGPGVPAFGERSASAAGVRQLLYSAGDAAIDLRITGKGKKFNVSGQVIGENFEGAEVTLSGAMADHSAVTNEFGDFEIQSVVSGIYELTVKGTEIEIFIDSVEIA